MRYLLRFLLFTAMALSRLQAEDPIVFEGVRFAGIWYYHTQNREEVAAQFPVGVDFGDRRELQNGLSVEVPSQLTTDLLAAMKAEQQVGGHRLVDRLADNADAVLSSAGNAWVICCALNYEHTETQQMRLGRKTVTKILAEVGFDVILCNFRDRRIAAMLPGRIQLIDAVEGTEASEERRRALLKTIYEQKLLPEFMELVKRPCSTFTPNVTIGIDRMEIRDELMRDVPEKLRPSVYQLYSTLICEAVFNGDRDELRRRTERKRGRKFTAEEIAENERLKPGVAVLPYSGGNDLVYYNMREQVDDGSRLIIRTAEDNSAAGLQQTEDGRSYILKKPDYTLDIVLPRFETQVKRLNKYQNQVAFVAGCQLTVRKDGAPIFSRKFFGSVQGAYTPDVKFGTPWLYYQAASYKMLESAVECLRKDEATKALMFESSVN